MNRQDATELATEICQLWPRGLNAHVWEEILQDDYSDPERARRAVATMKRAINYAPAIAHFHEHYLTAPSSLNIGEPVVCGDCGNDGWQPADSYLRNGVEYQASKPCGHCKHGRRAEQSTIWKERKALRPVDTEQETTS